MDIPDTHQGSFATDIDKFKQNKKRQKTEKKTLKKVERLQKIK